MPHAVDLTISQLARRMALNIMPPDTGDAPRWWWFEVFGRKIYCYNFEWRRRAIAHHDLHHVITGYPVTLRGEMQVATWEFAAGRYPNIFSNLFCLPLVAAGCVVCPKGVWAAFRCGRRSRSLFAVPITPELLGARVDSLRHRFMQRRPPAPLWLDAAAFAGLAAVSAVWLATPMLLTGLCLALRS